MGHTAKGFQSPHSHPHTSRTISFTRKENLFYSNKHFLSEMVFQTRTSEETSEVHVVEDNKPISTRPFKHEKVQRKYSCFQWTSKESKQTYDINYRVDGPENGKPILLIHG